MRNSVYPPFPWRLIPSGPALVTLHLVPVARARRVVPPSIPLLRVTPWHTLGALWLARYGAGSALEYHELVVCGAVVLHAGRPAPWVTHLFVDSEASVAGGREGLGAPKELARFRQDPDGRRVEVVRDGRTICALRRSRALWLWRGRLRARALHRHVDRPGVVSIHGNEMKGRVGLCAAGVRIPSGSPLAALGLGRARFGLCARDAVLLLGGAPFSPLRTLSAEREDAAPGGG